MDELNFNEISIETLGRGKETHQFVELRAVKDLTDIHFAQLRSYLKAVGLKVGLLLNFAKPTLEIRRVVN